MPLPCLPVDSAMSCSTHRPNEAIGSSTTNVSLSRGWPAFVASSPSVAPSHSPELDCEESYVLQAAAATPARSSSPRTSAPISAAGTRPKYDSAL